MRRYPTNSPEAAAQLMAYLLLADGMASAAEMQTLERHAGALGLSEERLRSVVQELCEEQLQFSDSSWCAGPDEGRAETLVDAIRDPALRRQLLALALELVQADRHLSEGEGVMLRRLHRSWGPEAGLIAG